MVRMTRALSALLRLDFSGFAASGQLGGSGEGVFVIPGHPVFWSFACHGGVLLEGGEIVSGVGFAEAACVDEGHEEVADSCAVFCFVEQGVFAMEDGGLEGAFGDVIVQWSAGLAEEEGEFLPVVEHVGDGFAEAAIGLDLPSIEFLFHPRFEGLHDGLAVTLVMLKALLGSHVLFFGLSVVSIDVTQIFEDASTMVWEVVCYFDEVAASMGIARGLECFVVFWGVP